jgi:hypothetical protein
VKIAMIANVESMSRTKHLASHYAPKTAKRLLSGALSDGRTVDSS